MAEEILRQPGQIEIDDLLLVSFKTGTAINLIDYLVELVIYESIFTPFLSGEILLSDSRNLIKDQELLGDEFLYVNVRTTTFSSDKAISKVFKIYSLDNKNYVKDGSSMIYKLGFSSVETFQDLINPIYKSFNGTPNDIVQRIYTEYLKTDRNLEIAGKQAPIKNSLTIFGKSANSIKFVSPGWSPVKCINWIASKSLPENNKAANFLFWETTKGFYFGSIGDIIEKQDDLSIGTYNYSLTLLKTMDEQGIRDHTYMSVIRSLIVEKSFDQIKNLMEGYTTNRLVNIDVLGKNFENIDYDHGSKFDVYNHLETGKAIPMFDQTTVRNPLTYTDINFVHKNLHTGYAENFDYKLKDIFGNRRSNMLELENFQMKITIPGRTDIEVGRTINIQLPKDKPGSEIKAIEYKSDEMYSGNYLITGLSHKINLRTHFITMNVTKDSLPGSQQQ
jgi:hypothetical protein